MRKGLGFWGLTAIGFSNIFGSGWLFSAMYAAQTAGPAALRLVGHRRRAVPADRAGDGAARGEPPGQRRHGSVAAAEPAVSWSASVVGVSVLLTVGGTAAEVTAILGYADHYLPWLQHGERHHHRARRAGRDGPRGPSSPP